MPSLRSMMPSDKVRVVTTGLVITLAIASCGGESRPSIEAWLPAWEHVLADVPPESVLAAGDPIATCNDALANIRTDGAALFPTPDEAIEDTVNAWVGVAEEMLFDCPPSDGFSDAYGELFRLQAEVETVLEIDLDS